MSGPRLVGVTGPIGSGKSLLCRLLSEAHGWPVLDADRIGHEALDPGNPVAASVVARFGAAVAGPDGRIDRAVLARVVFADERAREDLNGLVHPWILEQVSLRVAALKDRGYAGIILVDAALLPAWTDRCALDAIVWVRTCRETRRSRLEAKGVTRGEAERRMAAQDRLFAEPVPAGWLILDNDGTPQDLEAAAAALGRTLRARFPETGETETR